jgi:hypothetical protein
MAFIYDLSDTWNNAGISFNGIKLNATDTASAAGSKLIDLQINGASKFTVGKTGNVIATGLIESTVGGFRFPDGTTQTTKATVNSVSGTGTVNGITLTGTITNSGSLTLGGTLGNIANSQLTNSSITINGTSTPLGGSIAVGTVTSVGGTGTVSGLSLTGSITTSGSLTLGGTLVLTSGQVTDGLGYTPYNATNPAGYTTNVGTVTSVAGTGTVNGLTLTGSVTTSGSLTLGGTLGNIANSQLTNSAITINGTSTALGGSISVGTVTSVAALTIGTSGTDLASSVANGTTTPVITLNVPTASAVNRGALSSSDWSTFNAKQAALVSGTNIKTVGGASLLGSGDVGTIGLAYGGTGATTESGARTALGLGTAAVLNAGVAGGVATLDGSGTVPTSQLPGAVLGGLNYQGTWNASTNVPTLASSTGSKGYYYVVSVAGSTNLNGITDWKIGDWAVYDGTTWQKVDNTDAVSSVNGFTGAVVLTTSDVAQGTNLYFTQAAARGSVSAGTGISYDSGTGVITNSAPDQTVALTGAGTTVVTGTYPNFTITSNDSTVGTVTSVAASGGTTGLSFTGSPITTAGTLTLGGTLDLDNGGTGATTASGARTALGLGTAATTDASAYATAAQGAKADTAVQTIASTDGSVTITGTTAIDLSVAVAGSTSNVVLPIRNTTGATLTKGTAVYISGATGQLSTVSKAIANSDATSAQTLGLVTADIANNANGNVTLIGTITNINTSAYTDGQQLYLSPTTAGTLTATKPYAPNHLVYMAVVEHAHPSQGKLFVKVQNGYEMDELHDVSAQSPTNGQTLVYNSTTDLWEKNTVSLTAGINGTLPIANGGTGATTLSSGYLLKGNGTSAVSASVVYDTGTNIGIGTASPGAKLQVNGETITGNISVRGDGSEGGQITFSNADNTAGPLNIDVDSLGNGRLFTNLNNANLSIGQLVGTGGIVTLNTAGSERLRIDASGSVGIGTNAPSYKLHVSNSTAPILAENSGGGSYMVDLKAATGTHNVRLGNAGDAFLVNVNNAERMRITAAGDVGIGTTSTLAKLHVAANATYQQYLTGTDINQQIRFGYDTTNEVGKIQSVKIGVGFKDLVLQPEGANVGIGVTPSAWSGSFRAVQFSGGNAFYSQGGQASLGSNAYNDSGWKYAGTGTAGLFTNVAGEFAWFNAPSGTAGNTISFTQAMTLDASGNLGIGTASVTPIFGRTVKIYNAGSGGTLEAGGATVNARFFGSEGAGIAGVGTTTNTAFNFITNDTERMRLTSAGGLAVGTTTDPGAGNIGLAAGKYLQYSSTAYMTPEDNVAGARIVTPGAFNLATGGTAVRMSVSSDGTTTLNIGGVSNTHQFNYNESGGEIQLIDSTGSGPILLDNVSGLARLYKVGTGAMSIGTTGANYLQFVTNSSERMRVNSGGDVGIGTASPAGKLHIVAGTNNSLLFRGAINYATGGSIYAVNEANSVVTPMELAASSFFLTGGNVGIGVISAAYQLQIQGIGQDTAALTDAGNKGGSLYLRANGNTSGSGGALLFGTTFGNQTPFAAIKGLVTDGGANTTGDLAFSTRNATADTALTERMRIALNGFVGIGLSNPGTKLDVLAGTVGTTAGNEISIVNQRALAGGNSVQILSRLIRATNGTDWTTTTMRLQGRVDASDFGYIDLISGGVQGLAFGSAGTEMMRFNSSGNLGIGTSAPQNKLDIVGNMLSREDNSAGANPVLLRNSNTGNNTSKSSSALFQGTDTVGTVKNIGSIGFFPDDANYVSANLRFLVRSGDAAPTERMRIDASGFLLVGTTAPLGGNTSNEYKTTTAGSWPLTLNANDRGLLIRHSAASSGIYAYFEYNGGTNNGQISWSGGTTSYTTTSDARIKKNIVDAPDAGSLIDAIQVRSWDFKADDVHWRYGMVAQELLPVAPEAVTVPEDEKMMMGVDYAKLVPMLIKEVQSLRARVAQLEGN